MKKLLLTLILIPGMVFANGWNVVYTNIKDSEISVGALSGSYEWNHDNNWTCLLYTSPSPRDQRGSRMPSSA